MSMQTSFKLLLATALLLISPLLRAQIPTPAGTISGQEHNVNEKKINYGIKGGFTSTLFLASRFEYNGIKIDEIQNNYKIGYFASAFMRINIRNAFIQPEISYNVDKCDILFHTPDMNGGTQSVHSTIKSSIHSIDIPITLGYNIIKKGPYGLSIYAGPKMRCILDKNSKVDFDLNGETNLHEELQPVTLNLTTGVSVNISRIIFEFQYDIGLHNISKSVNYEKTNTLRGEDSNTISFNRRDNVLSFAVGLYF